VVTLSNAGDEDLAIDSVAFGGTNPDVFDGVDDCESDTLQPGQSCSGAISFYPRNKGIYNATVTITDNSSGSPQTITLTGIGVRSGSSCALVPNAAGAGAAGILTMLLTSIGLLVGRRKE
jgi:hypothetical protein